MIVVSQGGGGATAEPMTLFFSGSDLVVRLTNRLLFLWFMSGSVDVADVPDAAEDDVEDDAAMLLHGVVV